MKKLLLLLFFCAGLSISAFAQKSVIVATEQANVRETPSAQSKVVGKVKKGNVLSQSVTIGDWHYITFGNLRGWVHRSTVETPVVRERPRGDFIIDPYLRERSYRDVYADKWVSFFSDDEEARYYNPSTMVRKGDLVKVWTKTSNLKNFSSSSSYLIFDCEKYEFSILQTVEYNSDGKVVKDNDYRKIATFRSVTPESIGEILLKEICELSD